MDIRSYRTAKTAAAIDALTADELVRVNARMVELYDSTRTVAACGDLALAELAAAEQEGELITDPAEVEQIKTRLQYSAGQYDTPPTVQDW